MWPGGALALCFTLFSSSYAERLTRSLAFSTLLGQQDAMLYPRVSAFPLIAWFVAIIVLCYHFANSARN